MIRYIAEIASVGLPVAAFLLLKWMIDMSLTEEQEKDLDEQAKRFAETKGGK